MKTLKTIVKVASLVFVGYAIATNISDIRRYIRISTM
jgi:hypothetical protein